MATEVLRPQDCLVERLRVSPAGIHGRRHYLPNGCAKTYRKPGPARPDPKKRFNHPQQHQEPTHCRRWSSPDDIITSNNNNNNYNYCNKSSGARPVTPGGHVAIMRRGQSMDCLNSKIKTETKSTNNNKPAGESLVGSGGTQRFGQNRPETLPDVYAGSAFSFSPSPSSLPLPSFFKKEEFKSFDDSASRDLRRLLRLE